MRIAILIQRFVFLAQQRVLYLFIDIGFFGKLIGILFQSAI